jgi:hypothetical protein
LGGGNCALWRTGSGIVPETGASLPMWVDDSGNCGAAQPVSSSAHATGIKGAANCFFMTAPQLASSRNVVIMKLFAHDLLKVTTVAHDFFLTLFL